MTERRRGSVIVKLLAIAFCVSVIFSTISMNEKIHAQENSYDNYYDVTSQKI